jgi:hypothetical protein
MTRPYRRAHRKAAHAGVQIAAVAALMAGAGSAGAAGLASVLAAGAESLSLEARVQQLEDEATIRRLLDDYMGLLQSRFTFLGEQDDGSFRVTGSGVYHDAWIREEGEWRIAKRSVSWDLLAGASVPPATSESAVPSSR